VRLLAVLHLMVRRLTGQCAAEQVPARLRAGAALERLFAIPVGRFQAAPGQKLQSRPVPGLVT